MMMIFMHTGYGNKYRIKSLCKVSYKCTSVHVARHNGKIKLRGTNKSYIDFVTWCSWELQFLAHKTFHLINLYRQAKFSKNFTILNLNNNN